MSKRRDRRQAASPVSGAGSQAPTLSQDLMRMLATAANDITVPVYGTTLRSQDETLLAKGGAKGIRLYEEVRRDGHALAVLGKRGAKVLAREWTVTPASEEPLDVAAADLVERQLAALPFDLICRDLLSATLFGFSASEIEWGVHGSEIVPLRIVNHNQGRIAFDLDWQPRLLTREAPLDGMALPARKFIVHRHEPDGSDPYGRGLGRVLFWHVLFKREGVGFWSHFLEKYASPTPVAKYPLGTPPAEQDRLLHHLLALVQQGALAVPIGTEISFLEAARSGAASYEEWCRYWDEQTSVAVLGETLSTNLGGQGARAAAETHNAVSDGIADADADMLSATLNDTLVRWTVEFNLPGARPPTVWRLRPRNEAAIENQKAARAERVKKDVGNLFDLAARGYRPSRGIEESLTDILGEDIVADEPLRERFGLQSAGPGVRDLALGTTALTPQFAAGAPHDHGMGALAEQVAEAAQPAIDSWLDEIRAEIGRAIAAGEDLASLADRLLALYPDLAVDHLGNVLGAGFTVADLSGRSDVLDEVEG